MGESPLFFILLLVAGLILLGVLFLMSIALVAGFKSAASSGEAAGEVEWGVLRTYHTPEAAHLDRAMLEGCGVPVRLANEHIVGTDWMYGIAVGVDLRVPKDQLEPAELLLRDARMGDASVDLDDLEFADVDLNCQHCESSEVYRERPGIGWAMAAVVLIGLPLLRRKRYRCDRCGSRDAVAA